MQNYAIAKVRYSEIADFSSNVCMPPGMAGANGHARTSAARCGAKSSGTIIELLRKRQAQSEEALMKAIRSLVLACVAALAAGDALAQADLRAPLPQPLKIKQGMLNVPALSPLWLLPEEAAKYNIQIETVMFQRFADARTALVTGRHPPHRVRAAGHLARARPGREDRWSAWRASARATTAWWCARARTSRTGRSVADKRIGIGAGSISWLKFAASVQENGACSTTQLKIVNIVGGGGNYLRRPAKQGNRHGRGVAAVLRPGDRRRFRRLSDARPQPHQRPSAA